MMPSSNLGSHNLTGFMHFFLYVRLYVNIVNLTSPSFLYQLLHLHIRTFQVFIAYVAVSCPCGLQVQITHQTLACLGMSLEFVNLKQPVIPKLNRIVHSSGL